jgi:hypothetical protein
MIVILSGGNLGTATKTDCSDLQGERLKNIRIAGKREIIFFVMPDPAFYCLKARDRRSLYYELSKFKG